jgi:hypothetical protein
MPAVWHQHETRIVQTRRRSPHGRGRRLRAAPEGGPWSPEAAQRRLSPVRLAPFPFTAWTPGCTLPRVDRVRSRS